MTEPIIEKDYLKEPHILIVDDMPFMRSFIKTCVMKNYPNCVCEEAKNGAAAIKLLQAKSFNLVLCDWEMPDTKGDAVLKWVRENSLNKDMPFIMVTANNDKAGIIDVISRKVTDYLVKPIDCEVLSRKMRAALAPK